MPMIPFYTRFKDLAWREMRTIFVSGHETLPDGPYGLMELYCDELNCDCRRTIIMVITPDTSGKTWATLSYSWESTKFYEKKGHGRKWAREVTGASLDPLNAQTEHSEALLELFKLAVQDKIYVERLKRHYNMFKQAVRAEHAARRGRQ